MKWLEEHVVWLWESECAARRSPDESYVSIHAKVRRQQGSARLPRLQGCKVRESREVVEETDRGSKWYPLVFIALLVTGIPFGHPKFLMPITSTNHEESTNLLPQL